MTSSFRQAVTGIRTTAGTNVKGRVTSGTDTPLNIMASIQPLTGKDLETLPEGLRESGTLRLYTDFELRTADQKTKTPADVVTLYGKRHIVIQVLPWGNNVINHFKCIVSEAND